jgi:hypothetical protein
MSKISEWSEEYSCQAPISVGDKCMVKDDGAMRNAIVTKINPEAKTYDVEIIGLYPMLNIPMNVWRPVTETPSLTPDITPMLDEAFNTGVDQCIEKKN